MRVVPAPRLVGSDLHAWLAGPDLEAAGARVGLRGLAAEPYDVSGRVRFEDDGYELDGVEARAGRIGATVQGHLGRPPALERDRAGLPRRGAALSDLARRRGLQAAVPDDAFTVAGGLWVENGSYRADHVVAEAGADRVVKDGTLGPLPDLSFIDLSVAGAGPHLADLGRFLTAAAGSQFPRSASRPSRTPSRAGPAGFRRGSI